MNNASSPACKSTFGNHPLLVIPFFRRWPRSIARDMIYTFIWNTGFAFVFSVFGMLFDSRAGFLDMFWPNMVFAQCIGYLIHLSFALGGRVLPNIDQQTLVMRTFYYAGVPLVCVFAGMWIASGVVGGGQMQSWILQPRNITVMSLVSMFISCILLLIYIPRERAARAEAAMALDQVRVSAAEKTAALAQMQLLEAQIEPHFLYNTLAHIDSMIESDPRTARGMLARLIALLRATAAAATDTATLSRQVEWTRAYLELLQMRMGSRLKWTIDVDAGVRDAVVPPAILQPLVENAVKHGLEPKLAGGDVTITAHRAGTGLDLCVADTGDGFSATRDNARSTGIGLANLRARLQTLYGSDASMTIADNAPSGSRVTLHLPIA